MPVLPAVTHELRNLFKKGATPSKLIGHIRLRHPQEENWRQLVQAYFREAFAVPLIRMTAAAQEFDLPGLRYAHFNRHLVHQMIEARTKWDTAPSKEEAPVGNSWLDALHATDDLELREQAQPASVPELSSSWPQMDPAAQKYVRELMGSVNALHERVVILAQLAECLQQQVDELESHSGQGG